MMQPMRIGVSLRSTYHLVEPRVAVGRMVERTRAARAAGLDSLFVGDHHVTGSTYLQNVAILGRLLAEWGDKTAGALFILPLWHPVIVAEQVGTLAAVARGPFVLQVGLGDGEGQFAGMGASLRRRVGDLEGSLDVVRRLLAGETVTADRPVAIREPSAALCPRSRSTCGSAPARPRESSGPPASATGGSQARGWRPTRLGPGRNVP